MISDLHIGVKNNNSIFFKNTIEDYFNNFFFPVIQKNCDPLRGDILIVLGDVFDNRQNINSFVLSYTVQLFERLSKCFKKTYVICGNHDTPSTKENTNSALACLKHIENIEVVSNSPICVQYKNSLLGMLPWNGNTEELKEWAADMPNADYLFCHIETAGAVLTHKNTRSEKDFEASSLGKHKMIYSGHIHIKQKQRNIHYIGSPYHINKNDIGNTKGILILDTEKNEEMFLPNDRSPQYVVINMSDYEKDPLTRDKMINNYCTVVVSSEALTERKTKDLISELSDSVGKENGPLSVNIELYENKEEIHTENIKNNSSFSLYEFVSEYIDNCEDYSDKEKGLLKKLICEPLKALQ